MCYPEPRNMVSLNPSLQISNAHTVLKNCTEILKFFFFIKFVLGRDMKRQLLSDKRKEYLALTFTHLYINTPLWYAILFWKVNHPNCLNKVFDGVSYALLRVILSFLKTAVFVILTFFLYLDYLFLSILYSNNQRRESSFLWNIMLQSI